MHWYRVIFDYSILLVCDDEIKGIRRFTVGKYCDIIGVERSEIEEELNVDIMDLRGRIADVSLLFFL